MQRALFDAGTEEAVEAADPKTGEDGEGAESIDVINAVDNKIIMAKLTETDEA